MSDRRADNGQEQPEMEPHCRRSCNVERIIQRRKEQKARARLEEQGRGQWRCRGVVVGLAKRQ